MLPIKTIKLLLMHTRSWTWCALYLLVPCTSYLDSHVIKSMFCFSVIRNCSRNGISALYNLCQCTLAIHEELLEILLKYKYLCKNVCSVNLMTCLKCINNMHLVTIYFLRWDRDSSNCFSVSAFHNNFYYKVQSKSTDIIIVSEAWVSLDVSLCSFETSWIGYWWELKLVGWEYSWEHSLILFYLEIMCPSIVIRPPITLRTDIFDQFNLIWDFFWSWHAVVLIKMWLTTSYWKKKRFGFNMVGRYQAWLGLVYSNPIIISIWYIGEKLRGQLLFHVGPVGVHFFLECIKY